MKPNSHNRLIEHRKRIPALRRDYRLLASYYRFTPRHAYGAEAALGIATVLVVAIHHPGRKYSLKAEYCSQSM
jgi:hypothetical protein